MPALTIHPPMLKQYMMNRMIQYTLAVCLLLHMQQIQAQSSGSAETYTGIGIASGGTAATASETIYIGPGNYQVDGTWEIYSKYIWISSDAVITGTGSIHFYNPSAAGGAASATLVDGNSNSAYINLNLVLHNASNMVLTDQAAPAGSGWTDATGNASLTTGKDFLFNVANGNIFLGTHDMITATAATLSGYQPDRFVVTDGTGHLVHNNYTGAFTYPVGIAAGDYTPANINNSGTANTFHVLVQNYATSASFEAGANGIDRTWNIYADNAGSNAVINLQHNTVTNQTNFSNASNFVTRYSATTPNTTGDVATSVSAWQSNNLGAGTATGSLTTGSPVAGASERSRTYTGFATSAGTETAYYSKSSNQVNTLPLQLISFTAAAQQCNTILHWKTADEMNFDHFEIEYSGDGRFYIKAGQLSSSGNPAGSSYVFTTTPPGNEKAYYRLKIVDKDGAYKYSNILSLNTNCDAYAIIAYPNPTHNAFAVKGLQKGQFIYVYNTIGQLVTTKTVQNNIENINLGNYPKGIYEVLVTNKGQKLFVTRIQKW